MKKLVYIPSTILIMKIGNIPILVPFYSQWFPNQYKENPTANNRKRKISCDNLLFPLGKCFVANKSLEHLSSIEVGLLKFAVVELFWC